MEHSWKYFLNHCFDTVSPTKVDKKKAVAKKSTTPRSSTEEKEPSVLNTGKIWEAPWLKTKKPAGEKKPPKPLG